MIATLDTTPGPKALRTWLVTAEGYDFPVGQIAENMVVGGVQAGYRSFEVTVLLPSLVKQTFYGARGIDQALEFVGSL